MILVVFHMVVVVVVNITQEDSTTAAEEEVKRAGLHASAAADHVRSLAPLFARAAAALPPINVSSSDAVATFSQACARFRTLTGEGHQHAVR